MTATGTITLRRPLAPIPTIDAPTRRRVAVQRDALIPGTQLSAFTTPKHVLQALDTIRNIVRDAKVNFDGWDWTDPATQRTVVALTIRYAAHAREDLTAGMIAASPTNERRFLARQADIRNEWDRAVRLAGADNALGRLRHLTQFHD